MFQTKEQVMSPGADLHETERHDLPDREFKLTVINIPANVRRIMHEQIENFNAEIENIKYLSLHFFIESEQQYSLFFF